MIREKLGTIFGFILFGVILIGLVYVIVFTEKPAREIYSEIVIEGNQILPAQDYLIGSDLNKEMEYQELTLQEIRKRIMNHPYIDRAEIQSDGEGTVTVKVYEKNFKALFLVKNGTYLITQDFEIVKLKTNSDISDLPVISNVYVNNSSDRIKSVKNDELVRAFKIIDASQLLNNGMYEHLAEINLRYGGDVILNFTGITCPVIFGKGAEGKKIVILSTVWEGLRNQEKLFKNKSYVDLRFNNEIFIGKPVNTESNG